MSKAFEAKVKKAAEAIGEDYDDVLQFDAPDEKDDQFEDDGNLHIVHRGRRFCFDVNIGQDESGAEQNRKTRLVMEALGLERKIGDRVLVEEDDDDEDEDACEHCGRPY